MKRTVRRLVVAVTGSLVLLTFHPAAAFAQRGGRGGEAPAGGRGRGGEIQMDEQTVVDVATAILHLSDAQKQQVQSIFDAAVKTATPIAVQMENGQNALFDAVKAGKSEDEIKAIAAQQGGYRTQLLALQAETFAKLWALLNSEQRAEAGILIYDGIGQFLSSAHPPAPINLPNLSVPNPNQVSPEPPGAH